MVKPFAIAAAIGGTFIWNALAGHHLPISQSAGVIKTGQVDTHLTAGVRSFHSPQLNGRAVRYCSAGMRQCGKNVADNFCRSRGFKEAFTFQRDRDHIDQTTSFLQIKCWHPNNRSAYNQQVRANVSVFAKNQVFPVSCAVNLCLSI
jgi:hypothetical protein